MKLTVATHNGSKQIRARRVSEYFAVHRAIGADEMIARFTVTHIPTGYRIAQATDRDLAVKAAKLTDAHLGRRAGFTTLRTWSRRPLKQKQELRKALENIPGVVT